MLKWIKPIKDASVWHISSGLHVWQLCTSAAPVSSAIIVHNITVSVHIPLLCHRCNSLKSFKHYLLSHYLAFTVWTVCGGHIWDPKLCSQQTDYTAAVSLASLRISLQPPACSPAAACRGWYRCKGGYSCYTERKEKNSGCQVLDKWHCAVHYTHWVKSEI